MFVCILIFSKRLFNKHPVLSFPKKVLCVKVLKNNSKHPFLSKNYRENKFILHFLCQFFFFLYNYFTLVLNKLQS